MTKFNGIIEMGGLYKDTEPCALPTKPWANYLELDGAGNIPAFKEAASMERWTLTNTPPMAEQVLRWLHFEDNGKQLYICDRNILSGITWDDLNKAGYVDGNVVTIDGKSYLCRVLTGGIDYRHDDPDEDGGTSYNEWDRFIANEDGIAGLPALTDADRNPNADYAEQIGTEHNQLWNWVGMLSWCKETPVYGSSYRVLRGYNSARRWTYTTSSFVYPNHGWRPVLELL